MDGVEPLAEGAGPEGGELGKESSVWSVDLEGGEVYRTHVSSLRRTPPLLAGRSLQLPTHRCGGLRANGGMSRVLLGGERTRPGLLVMPRQPRTDTDRLRDRSCSGGAAPSLFITQFQQGGTQLYRCSGQRRRVFLLLGLAEIEVGHVPDRRDVYMQMRYLEARNDEPGARSVPGPLHPLPHGLGHLEATRQEGPVDVRPPIDLTSWHHKGVARPQRSYGEESDDFRILPDEESGQLPSDDAREHSSHTCNIPQERQGVGSGARIRQRRPGLLAVVA